MTEQLRWILVSYCYHLVTIHHYFLYVYNVLDLIRRLYFVNKGLHGLRFQFALLLEVIVKHCAT